MTDYNDYDDTLLMEAVREEMDARASAVTNEGREAMIAFLENAAMPAPEPFTVEHMQQSSHATAVEKGWWEDQVGADGKLDQGKVMDLVGTKLLLVTSEIAEAFEEFRSHRMMVYWEIPSFGRVCAADIMTGLDAKTIGTLETCAGARGARGDNEVRRQELLNFISKKFKPEGFGIELADALIRQGDLAEALTQAGIPIDLEYCVRLKAAYNRTRPHRHGGKRA